ncbi:MAG: GNAT family N-acetyltransferase [Muribaculaceae bacterium]|nr:GNAT family N-acetyltransferase [Muribaculaceae bacterium]
MKLSDGTIYLRAVEPEDADILFRHENAPERPETTVTTAPVSRLQIMNYIKNYSAELRGGGSLRLMICLENQGETIGSVDIYDYNQRDRRAYVAIFVEKRWRNSGYGTRALELLCSYAAETLGLHQLAAEVAVENEGSVRTFGKAGFKTCGRLRSWLRAGRKYYDVLIFQRLFFN